MDFEKVSGTFAFDLPIIFDLKTADSMKNLADGEYILQVKLVSEKGNLSCEKKILFAGDRFEKISADSKTLKKRFDLLEPKLDRNRKFALRVKLAELNHAIAGSRLEDSEKIISELKTELKE